MILDKIVESTRIRVEKTMQLMPQQELLRRLEQMGQNNKVKNDLGRFEKSLREPGLSFICEVKRASPSKGVIAEDFPYLSIAKEYEKAGAAAISVLTEPEYFLGSDQYLQEIQKEVGVPLLRKDFTIDEYQIYEAKLLGASAVLLICAVLKDDQLRYFLKVCDDLGLSALVEAHTEQEVQRAMECGAKIIGVNNRNLQTFEVDIETSIRLRDMVPSEIIYIAESGIRDVEDIRRLRDAGADGILIGETLMRSSNKEALISMFRQESAGI